MTITPKGHAFGWRRDRLDPRDTLYTYTPAPHIARNIPPAARLANFPIWDQGDLGSCTANGIAFGLLYESVKQNLLKLSDIPSRLMIYWEERYAEGTVDSDSGAEIRDGIKQVAANGACLESGPDSWPYDITKFTMKPPAACWAVAQQFQALTYLNLQQTPQQLRACIAEGFPVIFGFLVFPEMESDYCAQTGILQMPSPDESPLGGHCVAAVGYDDSKRMYVCRNSWSNQWGDNGYFYMPYEYMHDPNLASSFWSIRLVG